jgi:hypothetical protein
MPAVLAPDELPITIDVLYFRKVGVGVANNHSINPHKIIDLGKGRWPSGFT